MTLEMAAQVGGDYTDFMALIAATPEQKIAAVVKIVQYKDREQAAPIAGQPPRENFPVVADVLMANGPRAGEAALAETFLNGACTQTLRGVKNPKGPLEPVQPPRSPNTGAPWGPGTEIGVVFKIGKMGATSYLKADQPDAAEGQLITQVYANGQGWATAQQKAATAAPAAPAYQLPTPAAPVQPAVDPAYAAWQAQQAAAQAAPPAPVAPPAPPVDPQYAAWLASQQPAQPAAPAAPAPVVQPAGVGGPPADAPWRV